MLFESMLSFILTSLIFGFIPGPSVCFTIAYGIKFGTSATIPSIVGQLAANFLQILLVLIGLNSLLEQSIELFFILKMAGAFYLVYLGIKQWFAGKPNLKDYGRKNSQSIIKSFTDGFIVCGTNPKAILFYAVLLPQFILLQYNWTLQYITLGSLSILTGGIVLITYTLLAGRTRYWFINKGYWRIQNRLTGSLMVGAGTALALLQKSK